MPTKQEAKELLSNGEIGKTEFIKDEIIRILNDSKIYQIDLNKQHRLVKRTIKDIGFSILFV